MPSSVSFSSTLRQKSRNVTVKSVAAGCTEITARLGTDTKSALFTVVPFGGGGTLSLQLSDPGVFARTATGTVRMFGSPGTHTVLLSSSKPAIAIVPASVNVFIVSTQSIGVGDATFPITAFNQPVCAVISATLGPAVARALLKRGP